MTHTADTTDLFFADVYQCENLIDPQYYSLNFYFNVDRSDASDYLYVDCSTCGIYLQNFTDDYIAFYHGQTVEFLTEYTDDYGRSLDLNTVEITFDSILYTYCSGASISDPDSLGLTVPNITLTPFGDE